MKFTFKQFNHVMGLPEEDITEEKLSEIFGFFKKDDKFEKAKKEREEMIKKLGAKKYALELKKKNLAMKQAGQSNSNRSGKDDRYAELEWRKGLKA